MTEKANVFEIPVESLDASNAAQIKGTLMSLIKANPNMILDLNHLQFLDSSGMGAFLAVLRRANSLGGDVKLSCMSKPVRSIFALVRMHRIFEIFNDREEAEKSFSEDGAEGRW
jgi:anti-sigma B factor antagonist